MMVTIHFTYMWFDRTRKMFYVGQHSGQIDDGYISSSRWLSGEIRYRPQDFKRRIIKIFDTKNEAQKYEGYLLTLIRENEWGIKYYNSKQGKPKGVPPWNKGKTSVFSKESLEKISKSRIGKPTTKGMSMPKSAENGRKSAKKLSQTATGRRKKLLPDGSWTWEYPDVSVS